MVLQERPLHARGQQLARQVAPVLARPKMPEPVEVLLRHARRVVVRHQGSAKVGPHSALVRRAGGGLILIGEGPAVDPRQVADGVERGYEARAVLCPESAVRNQLADLTPAVGGLWEGGKRQAGVLAYPNKEHSPAHLRRAVLRGQQLSACGQIAEPAESVGDLSKEPAAIERRQPRHGLDNQRLGPQSFGDAEELVDKPVSGIGAIALTHDAEALAGRPTNEQVQLAHRDPGGQPHVLGGQ